ARGRLDLDDRFLRLELEQRLTERDGIADVLQPTHEAGVLHDEPDLRNFLRDACHSLYPCPDINPRIARTMFSRPGSRACSSSGVKGMGTNGQPTRITGASSSSNDSLPMRAAISAPTPPF